MTPVNEPSTAGFALDVLLVPRRPPRLGRAGRLLRRVRRAIRPRRLGYRLGFAVAKALTRRSGRRVLFVSSGKFRLAGNLKEVHDRMLARGLDRQVEVRTLFRPEGRGRVTMRRQIAMFRSLAAADVLLVSGSQQRIVYRVAFDRDVRFIQLWHASGAFKTVGYSKVGKPGGPDPFSRVHRNYTHAIVSSDHDVPFYAEAFGIPEERVVPTGIPRMDRFFDDRGRAEGVAAARAAFPETVGRMTILFAPTYRGRGESAASYPLELLDYPALHALAVEKDAVVLIRMHPFAKRDLQIPERYRDRILDGSAAAIDVNDLLFAVDLLITDYSSIVFEFSTLGRPMLFYAYDLEEYIATRDFYEPFETFVPGRIVRTFDELIDAIRREDYELEKVAAFAERHFAHLDAGSTDRVIDQLILAP